MAEQKRRGGSKKDLRSGRNKAYYAYYRGSISRRNKLRKLNRHIVRHANDALAARALDVLNNTL